MATTRGSLYFMFLGPPSPKFLDPLLSNSNGVALSSVVLEGVIKKKLVAICGNLDFKFVGPSKRAFSVPVYWDRILCFWRIIVQGSMSLKSSSWLGNISHGFTFLFFCICECHERWWCIWCLVTGVDGESGDAEEVVSLVTLQTPPEDAGRAGGERPEVEENPGQWRHHSITIFFSVFSRNDHPSLS